MKRSKIALIICLIIFFIILIEIFIYMKNGIGLSRLNNMYKDIESLEEKVAIYYLNNNSLPIKEDSFVKFDFSNNPNDNQVYYELDLSKFQGIELSYGKGKFEKDKYIIDEQSHTIYYYEGIEYNNTKFYGLQIEYKEINLEEYQ